MKSIAVNGSTIGIAGAVIVAAVGITWAIANVGTHSHIRSLREQIATCEGRAKTKLAQTTRAANAALAATKRETTRVQQELKSNKEQLRQANEKKEQELALANADRSRAGALSPGATFELSPGDTLAN